MQPTSKRRAAERLRCAAAGGVLDICRVEETTPVCLGNGSSVTPVVFSTTSADGLHAAHRLLVDSASPADVRRRRHVAIDCHDYHCEDQPSTTLWNHVIIAGAQRDPTGGNRESSS